ncbi:hypothetical protein [Parvibaculum sp.]|jgi:hypothetical protein|uniref:hypothetical protein n=1 Tax=Parvibaculum sp. TaxID=2024848 RepID=UPI002A304E12|nr:hypothetical protein [Parvibaculum sp.]
MRKHITAATVAAAVLGFSAPVLAQDLAFMLANDSGHDLIEFYASPSDISEWEEDILGQDILRSGDAVRVIIADGREQCTYDLRMVFADGDVVEDTANLCDTGSYTIE